jgi:predicted phosphoribosyltransferase
VHPDVPKEYVEKKLSDSEIYCVKNTSSLREERHVAVKNKNIILVDDGIATGNTLCRVSKYYKATTCKNVAVPVLP